MDFQYSDQDFSRFLNLTASGSNGCIEWQGCIQTDKRATGLGGYGHFWFQGKTVKAHRFIWQAYNGRELDPGMEPDHLCCNRRCVNPLHLEAVTSVENKKRISAPYRRYLTEQGRRFLVEMAHVITS